MDEDLSVKAPVTRLRRRMSVEAEDSPLPTTPSTPTKKRATRLAAKPQLELIDEVATESVPKKTTTRKVAVKENVEAELNTGTPTALTPSRRSTRIRSNTSILSETTAQSVESPRAKRATRRNSQLGSDNESAAVTPARQTRRTRKTSVTNVDKPVEDENIAEVTTTNTDLEKGNKELKASETDNHSPTIRKSPRLNKIGGKLDDDTDNKESNTAQNSSVNTIKDSSPAKESNKTVNDSLTINKSVADSTPINDSNKTLNDAVNTSKTVKDSTPDKESNKTLNHSVNNNKSLKESTPVKESNKTLNDSVNTNKSLKDSTPLKDKELNANTEERNSAANKSHLNKSTSAIERVANDQKNKRNRTKSWTTLSSLSNVEFISDNEEAKNKIKNTLNTSLSGAGDASSKVTNDAKEMTKEHNTAADTIKPCVVSLPRVEIDTSDAVKLFENSPSTQQPLVLIEDSDSCSVDKLVIDIQDGEDQCVPVVVNPTNKSPKKHEQSVEPMDIDESMPVNVTIDDFSDSSASKENEISGMRKSVSEKSLLKNDSINKSKRKSSISNQSTSQSKISNEGDKNESINKSINTSASVYKLNSSTANKSKRTSSISEIADEVDSCESKTLLNQSSRKSSITVGEENNGKLNESSKSKRKSSVSANDTLIHNDSNTQKNISMSIDEDVEKQNNSTRRSKRNTRTSLNDTANQKSVVDEINESKSSNKSKRNSISQTNSQILENKSTLVISHLKDVSTNDINNIMSPNVTNNELSKSLNGPDIKNKGMDMKNLSLNNYLTSTPIQQKPFQKLAMQINTSIINTSVEDKSSGKTPKKSIANQSLDSTNKENKEEKVVVPKNKYARAVSSSDSSDDEPVKELKAPIRQKPPTKNLDSSDSSDSGLESKAPIRKLTKKMPNKKLENLDSDEESDSNSQQNKKPSKKKVGNLSKSNSKNNKTSNKVSSSDNSDTSDDSDEKASKDKSKMIDDEASEASDNYESGDSRDDEDRRYEDENEIVEKGETLDSEEDISNDSDYEKDSFLVSSDGEDNELLSGSGDDLSMSDNELTMSAKSKKKFNERKLKQQKNASKEMYKARHEDNDADNSKSKKTKRQRLESSNLESENENDEPKKSNRLRIDSSQDSNVQSDADESIGIKKKKSKRLSESVHEMIANEMEVSICNQSTTEKSDPLSVAIKQEPKTPQKNFDISTVAINDKIEEVEIDGNASILPQNESLDPLQATAVADFENSSSSSDMEIFDMYDSVLSNLKPQTNKIKTADTSLNLNKKSKKTKDPVIDQLNLTQTKAPKTKNKPAENIFSGLVKSQAEKTSKVINVEDNSSDSIDMKLLFPEDSNDSETNASQFNPNNEATTAESFIPLKRTEAQTNIPGNMDTSVSELNVSKKNKKRKSQLPAEEISNIIPNDTEEPDNDIKIIIDTKGTHEDGETPVVLTNSSKKKKKDKSLNESKILEIAEDNDCTDGIADAPVEVSFTKQNKKKNKNKSFDVSVNDVHSSFSVAESHSAKKSKRKSESTTEFVETQNADNTVVEEILVNVSIKSDKKKKKNKLDVSQTIEPIVEPTSAKKKSKTSICVEDVDTENTDNTFVEEIPVNVSIKSDKKKKKNKLDVSQTVEPVVEATSAKKKSKTSICVEDVDTENTALVEISAETSMTTEKKKKKKKNKQKLESSQDKTVSVEESDNEAPEETSYRSEKKSEATETVTDEAPTSNEKKHKKNKKKKNKNKNLSQSMEKSDDNLKTTEQEINESAQRKRKFFEADSDEIANEIPVSAITTSNEKKKRKIQEENASIEAHKSTISADGDSPRKSKKNKKSKICENVEEDPQRNTKKRKHSNDDDTVQKVSKVAKQNSFDIIHVPTLPDSIINQLSEKPQKMSKNKKKKPSNSSKFAAIATMPFLVEEAERRKNKPSNYLEQSIYLNDTPVKTKQKHINSKPKVLPFIPTALTSDSGYTSQFNINVLPKYTQFVAQASNVENFKESFLVNQRIKKMGTMERCKIQRNHKISKF